MVSREDALPGRDAYPYPLAREHVVLGTDMLGPDAPTDPMPWPADTEEIVLAGGCFWGIERIAWQVPGVHTKQRRGTRVGGGTVEVHVVVDYGAEIPHVAAAYRRMFRWPTWNRS